MSDSRLESWVSRKPELAPFAEAMRRVASGAVLKEVIHVDSHLITSFGHQVGLEADLNILAMELDFKVVARLHVKKGRPPTGKVTISRRKPTH